MPKSTSERERKTFPVAVLPSIMSGSRKDSPRHTSKQLNGPSLITPPPSTRRENGRRFQWQSSFDNEWVSADSPRHTSKQPNGPSLITPPPSTRQTPLLLSPALNAEKHKRERAEDVSSDSLPLLMNGSWWILLGTPQSNLMDHP
ncbi:hypothetical protein CDAR_208281 [Caerostris darwini]|uniref:Uncharacterized protein n=1 Tax=Caerostris darwini TaxID=1538125 RepID=A0AAV4RAP2_9ARAC|nr:hypothetical protein CDAR_208281 [Caerostris darwini]